MTASIFSFTYLLSESTHIAFIFCNRTEPLLIPVLSFMQNNEFRDFCHFCFAMNLWINRLSLWHFEIVDTAISRAIIQYEAIKKQSQSTQIQFLKKDGSEQLPLVL